MSSRRALAIEGHFYTNGLELKHKLQKKRLKEAEVPRGVSSVTEELQTWAQDFFNEEVPAVRGLGKYRLAPGYDHFVIDPIKWNRWGLERQAQHISTFRQFIAKSYDSYSKPSSAGHKAWPAGTKRGAELPEPNSLEIVVQT